MRAKRGIAWLMGVLLVSLFLPICATAADSYPWAMTAATRPTFLFTEAQSSLEAQMLGERPSAARPALPSLLPEGPLSVQTNPDGGATVRLPYKFEMNISFLYNREPGAGVLDSQKLSDSPLLMKYSMDYRVLPNLQIGLNAYLYRPADDGLSFQRPFGRQVMGLGPELKYDLGRWSFLLKSQMESGGGPNRTEERQHWFRVWYAF